MDEFEELLEKLREKWGKKREMYGDIYYEMVGLLGGMNDHDDQFSTAFQAGIIIGESTSPEDAIARLKRRIAEIEAENEA